MAQNLLENPAIWAIPYLGWGMLFLIVVAIGSKVVLRLQRRHMRHRTDEAGLLPIEIPVRTGPSWLSTSDIEGVVFCVGLLIFLIVAPILAIFGISLPLTLPEHVENLIGFTFVIILGALFWGGGIITLLISIYDYRTRKRQLKEVLEAGVITP